MDLPFSIFFNHRIHEARIYCLLSIWVDRLIRPYRRTHTQQSQLGVPNCCWNVHFPIKTISKHNVAVSWKDLLHLLRFVFLTVGSICCNGNGTLVLLSVWNYPTAITTITLMGKNCWLKPPSSLVLVYSHILFYFVPANNSQLIFDRIDT